MNRMWRLADLDPLRPSFIIGDNLPLFAGQLQATHQTFAASFKNLRDFPLKQTTARRPNFSLDQIAMHRVPDIARGNKNIIELRLRRRDKTISLKSQT